MELTLQGTEFLNPGQTSVLGADQPMHDIIKLLQWQFPETLGEDKLARCISKTKMHMMIGKLLRDWGWVTVISQAEVY